jgi:microsomal dipeptidase-like Zn-dependent dipeptidase
VSEERKEWGDCDMLETPEKIRELQKKLYQNAKQERESDSDCESFWKRMIGKPYSGKLNVRFDEGELEIEHG